MWAAEPSNGVFYACCSAFIWYNVGALAVKSWLKEGGHDRSKLTLLCLRIVLVVPKDCSLFGIVLKAGGFEKEVSLVLLLLVMDLSAK